MAARGLKTKIASNVAFLLLLSALITDILVIVVIQNVMVKGVVSDIEFSTKTNGRLFYDFHGDNRIPGAPDFNPENNLPASLNKYASFAIWDTNGQSLFEHQASALPVTFNAEIIHQSLQHKKNHTVEQGVVWAVFWWHSEAVTVFSPIYQKDQLRGVAATQLLLTPIYEKLRHYNKPIFLYIILNTAILTIVGLYRIFRLYLSPIDRIVRQADEFQYDEDLLFAFRHEDNELNRLSFSLNQMLSRISSDKKTLRKTVSSLEQANQDLQNAQREVIRAEKLASVGRLAAGIAHEIGNPIGIVLGYLDMLKDHDLSDDDKADFLLRTEKEVQRINQVIRQLLDLARPQGAEVQQFGLHGVLTELVDVMRLQPMLRNMHLELDLQAHRDHIEGNQDQLRQVFLNLILNAADAIRSRNPPVDGVIKIATRMAKAAEHHREPWIQIQLEDNGIGIDPEQLQNIFDPFYTTKEPGKGTGLGLSVSYMIVEGAGGSMFARNHSDHGAIFSIELPLLLQVPEAAGTADEPSSDWGPNAPEA